MSTVPDLSKLSHAEKDRLILALFAQLAEAQERIAAQDARIAALEARLEALTRPPNRRTWVTSGLTGGSSMRS